MEFGPESLHRRNPCLGRLGRKVDQSFFGMKRYTNPNPAIEIGRIGSEHTLGEKAGYFTPDPLGQVEMGRSKIRAQTQRHLMTSGAATDKRGSR